MQSDCEAVRILGYFILYFDYLGNIWIWCFRRENLVFKEHKATVYAMS